MSSWSKEKIEKDKPFWVALSFFEGIGPLRFKLLLKHFKTAKNIWQAEEKVLKKTGLGLKTLEKFFFFRRNFNPQKTYTALLNGETLVSSLSKQIVDHDRLDDLSWVQKVKSYRQISGPIQVIIAYETKYPKILQDLPDRPFLLYVKSKNQDLDLNDFAPAVSVVGTRRMTSYGKQVTRLIVSRLASSGLTIVSGLAAGVDAESHLTALASNGKTLAVLGCGVDIVYPAANTLLYQQILQSADSALLSEFPPGFPPLPGNFPSRNRLVAGLSLGTVVTEGAKDSGSLITARLAAHYGREVFAVPGPITSPLSAATSKLLKAGAKLVASAEDILEEWPISRRKGLTFTQGLETSHPPSPEEQKILDLLANAPLHFDELSRRAGLPANKLGSLLSLLEVKGMIENFGQMVYGLKY